MWRWRPCRSVHPRSRGEHHQARDGPSAHDGSSPLARGTRPRMSATRRCRRFIPARAGNTCLAASVASISTVHPRSRGEHALGHHQDQPVTGSSPLARGTLLEGVRTADCVRFIPARAGNTSRASRSRRSWSVHPRSRGEHTGSLWPAPRTGGSSPLARGTLRRGRARAAELRFIPARAGNTPAAPASPRRSAVHPRSRGEHECGPAPGGDEAGSSPLARGTQGTARPWPGRSRFIPARAGNTHRTLSARLHPPVHPRSRGEHSIPFGARRPGGGSSPLARGTRARQGPGVDVLRFIPARAGNTIRVRPLRIKLSGSSPLARGTRHVPGAVRAPARFIPARAGNTGRGRSRGWSGSVHPRSRGEHPEGARRSSRHPGSSPLARGTPPPYPLDVEHTRFIPARAGNTPRPARSRRTTTVHPRSRGEHVSQARVNETITGSSPLARGTHIRAVEISEHHRFIPARAGNTGRGVDRHPCRSVHPRSRGEHAVAPTEQAPQPGSSPLARGTLHQAVRPELERRFIPARAGNTPAGAAWRRGSAVHPRSRGEHGGRAASSRRSSGSSPLARGTPGPGDALALERRFIPARAGNTSRWWRGHAPPPVHPRSRGEHVHLAGSMPWPPGSSPLARGTRAWRAEFPGHIRFIPARAGNTPPSPSPPSPEPVHPRSRGEHVTWTRSPGARSGSSPLARGTPCGMGQRGATSRFIPARAGNTSSASRISGQTSVHPRSRGEHVSSFCRSSIISGSSPLARGTPASRRSTSTGRRFIPARAGNTTGRRRGDRHEPVHPRSRGEHFGAEDFAEYADGSSPLARGTRRPARRRARRDRFIPARAGNTAESAIWGAPRAVHPRSRGEHAWASFATQGMSGSSPLARGTPVLALDAAHPLRFIPARAGNTTTIPA